MQIILLCLLLGNSEFPRTEEFRKHELESFFSVSPEMDLFLKEHVSGHVTDQDKLRSLLHAIFDKKKFNMTYEGEQTLSPIETFRQRKGNCLSFTGMFIALARRSGLWAVFQEVSDISSWEQSGQFTIYNRHINAIVFVEGMPFEVDFNNDPGSREFRIVNLTSDARGIAHYYNNLGAEKLEYGEYREARELFEKSIFFDATFSQGWTNLGVLERITGRYQEAEACYLKALEVNPTDFTAKMNLAYLYKIQGKVRETEKLVKQIRAYREKNPYYHFSLGRKAFKDENYKQARTHFKKAIRLHHHQPQFLLSLARVYDALGKERKARRLEEKAKSMVDSTKDIPIFEY